MKKIYQFVDFWGDADAPHQISVFLCLLIYAAVYNLWRATMGKRVWPRIVLAVISIAYAIFAVTFMSKYPGAVFVAGVILGAVLISVFIFTLLRGRPPDE